MRGDYDENDALTAARLLIARLAALEGDDRAEWEHLLALIDHEWDIECILAASIDMLHAVLENYNRPVESSLAIILRETEQHFHLAYYPLEDHHDRTP